MTARYWSKMLVPCAIASLALTACSNDTAATPSPSPTATATVADVSAKTTTACDSIVTLDSSPQDPSTPEYRAALSKQAALLTTVAANTTGDVSTKATLIATRFSAAGADAEAPDPLNDPEVAAAVVTMSKWSYDSCGYTKMDVTASERSDGDATHSMYDGIPATVAAGNFALSLTNSTATPQIAVIAKRKPGVTVGSAELLADPDGQSKVDIVAGDAGAVPGATGYLLAKLDTGSYIVFSPLPGADGTPSFMNGMFKDLIVT